MLSGMEVLKFLKNRSMYSNIPIVILSTNSEQKIIDETYKSSANGYKDMGFIGWER